MSLRLRLAATVSAAMLAIGVGAGFANPAFAANDQAMCVKNLIGAIDCAYVSSLNFGTIVGTSTTLINDWNAPGGTGQISLFGASGCMQIDPNDSNVVRLESCTGNEYAEWTASSLLGRTQFRNPHTGLCLNDHYQVHQVNATTCNGGTDEAWGAK